MLWLQQSLPSTSLEVKRFRGARRSGQRLPTISAQSNHQSGHALEVTVIYPVLEHSGRRPSWSPLPGPCHCGRVSEIRNSFHSLFSVWPPSGIANVSTDLLKAFRSDFEAAWTPCEACQLPNYFHEYMVLVNLNINHILYWTSITKQSPGNDYATKTNSLDTKTQDAVQLEHQEAPISIFWIRYSWI
jgi:hypothetical protein